MLLFIYLWALLGVMGFIMATKCQVFIELFSEIEEEYSDITYIIIIYLCLLILLILAGPISFVGAILHLYEDSQ